MKKVMDQKINLTLEEIVTILPKFMQELKFLSEKGRKYLMSLQSINSQEQTTTQELIIQDKMHSSCPLGMIEVSVGQEGHIVKSLVDTGAELSIIPEVESIKARLPMRVLNMRLRGIRGHSTAIVGLSRNTIFVLPSGDERRVHFFVARGAVHTVIGRPFLAYNGIILVHSQQKGEILSYKESDGRRLFIPICTPESKGWHTGPPRGMEMCNMARITELKNEGQKSKSPLKKGISNLDNNEPLLHPKFYNTHSSNMEASTIKVEPIQKKGLKLKQIVKSVSNKYGKNGTYWKKEKDAVSNEEYSNESKVKGSSKIKRYFSKIICKIKNNHKSQVSWDFQCPGAQPTITEEINPTKSQNIITTPEVEPKESNLETNLSEEELYQTKEPLDLDQVIKNLNFMELEMNTNTATTD
ncbi:hypothetical protein O181_108172, partial [Austropuccinia psidii MF-1]|nr:hypothetical protein [Austropuccinia psidii MF-1]